MKLLAALVLALLVAEKADRVVPDPKICMCCGSLWRPDHDCDEDRTAVTA